MHRDSLSVCLGLHSASLQHNLESGGSFLCSTSGNKDRCYVSIRKEQTPEQMDTHKCTHTAGTKREMAQERKKRTKTTTADTTIYDRPNWSRPPRTSLGNSVLGSAPLLPRDVLVPSCRVSIALGSGPLRRGFSAGVCGAESNADSSHLAIPDVALLAAPPHLHGPSVLAGLRRTLLSSELFLPSLLIVLRTPVTTGGTHGSRVLTSDFETLSLDRGRLVLPIIFTILIILIIFVLPITIFVLPIAISVLLSVRRTESLGSVTSRIADAGTEAPGAQMFLLTAAALRTEMFAVFAVTETPAVVVVVGVLAAEADSGPV